MTTKLIPVVEHWTEQPSSDAEIADSPLTQRLQFAFSGSFTRESVSGVAATPLLNGVIRGGQRLAVRCIRSGFDCSGYQFATGTKTLPWDVTDQGVSFLVLLNSFTESAFGNGPAFLNETGGSLKNGVGTNTSSKFCLWLRTATHASATTIPASYPSLWIATSVAGGPYAIYLNGALDASGTSSASNATFAPWHIGGEQSQYGVSADVALVLAWSRILGPDEVAQLTENPWQVFSHEPIYVEVPEAAAGGFFARPYYDMISQSQIGA